MTDVYEGSLIRMFRRLEELIRQMSLASKVMGNEELEKKFDLALAKVKRGNVFLLLRHSHTFLDNLLTHCACCRHCCGAIPLSLIVLCGQLMAFG